MHTSISKSTLILSLAFTAAAMYAAPAAAATKSRSNYQNAGGNCHAANGLHDIERMKRNPLGYRNAPTAGSGDDEDEDDDIRSKGDSASNTSNTTTGNVQVICNFAADVFSIGNPNSGHIIKVVQLFARNTLTDSDKGMACTITAGYATSSTNYSNTKSMTLPKSGVQQRLSWSSADNGGRYLPGPASVVCSVPVGVELNDAIIVFDVDVGS